MRPGRWPRARRRLGMVGALLAQAAILVAGSGINAHAEDAFAAERRRMVEEIASLAHALRSESGRAALRAPVMAAMAKVPRHAFVPPAQRRSAYANRPLPIGLGQTISQPFIVALMTDLMEIKPSDRVLEVGTGSGYQAAVLAHLAGTVYTIEIVAPLAREAAARLHRLGYRNVVTRTGDGYRGWPEHAPYDAIMVTAAAREVPQPLIDQLERGGRLVVPVGGEGTVQSLLLIEKRADGSLARRTILAVRFVPLTDETGSQR